MAVNTNKRIAVKWVRDRAKGAYEKANVCHICASTVELELHHTHSLTLLLEKWAKDNSYDLSNDEEVIALRDEFIDAHHSEIYDMVFTLCSKHHKKLHSLFGKAPLLSSADKQNRWIEKQKAKALGLETESTGSFSKFY